MSVAGGAVAVVSGGGSGIGAACARALARRGHSLALLGRRRQPLLDTLRATGVEGRAFAVDVRDAAALTACLGDVERELGEVGIVVAAAGVAPVAPFVELSSAAIRESIETNLVGTALLFHTFLPAMLRRRSGTLVAVLSVAARRVFPGWSAYAASKWGLLGLVESLREELAGTGVRVLAITPGATETPLWDGVEGKWERSRMIPAEAVAEALAWALDDRERVVVEEIRLQPSGGNL
jgi:NADP-dependent 3-hydroxy acid dehydrogenase YdfG